MRMVVKSDGEVERFDYKKLQKSLSETFLIVRSPEGQSNEFVRKTLLEFAVRPQQASAQPAARLLPKRLKPKIC